MIAAAPPTRFVVLPTGGGEDVGAREGPGPGCPRGLVFRNVLEEEDEEEDRLWLLLLLLLLLSCYRSKPPSVVRKWW
jgi:hypothetical protein